MKISLITSTFNSESTLQDTFDSIRSQNYEDLEYIVIDGGSTDGTIDLIKTNQVLISKYVSEPDKGIYDALNKGINLSTGEVVGIMHSDDVFASKTILKHVSEAFGDDSIDAVYGDLVYVEKHDLESITRQWKSNDFDRHLFYNGWMPAHPTFYLKRKHYATFGSFNLSFYTAADYELMLRMLFKHSLKAMYVPETFVKMRVGGQSNVTLKNRWIANKEDARAWKVNGLKPKFYTRWLKPISKIGQFFN